MALAGHRGCSRGLPSRARSSAMRRGEGRSGASVRRACEGAAGGRPRRHVARACGRFGLHAHRYARVALYAAAFARLVDRPMWCELAAVLRSVYAPGYAPGVTVGRVTWRPATDERHVSINYYYNVERIAFLSPRAGKMNVSEFQSLRSKKLPDSGILTYGSK